MIFLFVVPVHLNIYNYIFTNIGIIIENKITKNNLHTYSKSIIVKTLIRKYVKI